MLIVCTDCIVSNYVRLKILTNTIFGNLTSSGKKWYFDTVKMQTCVFDFNDRDVDETISWIKEKEQLMASDDFGRDLASVQALLRKHEGLERDLAALEDKARTISAYLQSRHVVKKLRF